MGTDAADNKDAVGLPHTIHILDVTGEQTQERPPVGNMDISCVCFGVEEVGLETIGHYIQVRRQHIAAYIVDRPIFG